MARRQQLWDDLIGLSSMVSGDWAVMRDFNCTLASRDRQGGLGTHYHRDMEAFRNTLQVCELIDTGFQGHPFTWKKGNLEVRLD